MRFRSSLTRLLISGTTPILVATGPLHRTHPPSCFSSTRHLDTSASDSQPVALHSFPHRHPPHRRAWTVTLALAILTDRRWVRSPYSLPQAGTGLFSLSSTAGGRVDGLLVCALCNFGRAACASLCSLDLLSSTSVGTWLLANETLCTADTCPNGT